MNTVLIDEDQASTPEVDANRLKGYMMESTIQLIVEILLRFHRKNPTRVAFGTPPLVAEYGPDEVAAAYESLLADEMVEPIHHTVVKNDKPRTCFRITKQGLQADSH